jgi:hypothetical protein
MAKANAATAAAAVVGDFMVNIGDVGIQEEKQFKNIGT